MKQHQQAQQHNGAEKSGVGRGNSVKSKTNPTTTGSTTTKTPSAVTNNTTSSTASSPALSGVHHRDSPGTPYIKPLLSATPPIPSVYSSGKQQLCRISTDIRLNDTSSLASVFIQSCCTGHVNDMLVSLFKMSYFL